MSEFNGGDSNGYYDDNGVYHTYGDGGYSGGYGGGGGDASYTPPTPGGDSSNWDWWGGGEEHPYYPTGDAVPPGGSEGKTTFKVTGTGIGDTGGGGYTPTQTGGQSFSNPFGGSQDYFFNPGRTGGIDTGGGGSPTTPINTGGGVTPPRVGSSSVSNTQNNTQNNSNVLAQSVGLPAVSPISSGVPQAQASSFKPNVISPGGGLHEGAPPPMPTPHAQVPPSLHPEKPTDWSNIAFGAASPSQAKPKSALGRIGGALGSLTGLGQQANRYKGIYDSLMPKKPRTPEEINAEMYRDLYGGQ